MRILLAVGRKALLGSDEAASGANLQRTVEAAAAAIADLATEHELIVTHGNRCKLGLLTLEDDEFPEVSPYPLELFDVEREARVGHMLELALRNALPDRDLVSVLSEVIAAADDPAFLRPSRPVGPVYSEAQAQSLRLDRGWAMQSEGSGFRRLVPAPEPHAIAEIRSLRVLVGSGALVICAAGGGMPVALDGLGAMHEVEAVIDEDLTAALLARRLDADLLLMLTDVDAVHADWEGPNDRPILSAEPAELRGIGFAARSIGPKVEAACRFAEATGRRAAIGALKDAARIARAEAGTQVLAAVEPAISATRRLPKR